MCRSATRSWSTSPWHASIPPPSKSESYPTLGRNSNEKPTTHDAPGLARARPDLRGRPARRSAERSTGSERGGEGGVRAPPGGGWAECCRADQLRPGQVGAPAGRRRGVDSPARTTPWSVSYTHLRAHETRHDLVCRLLLE